MRKSFSHSFISYLHLENSWQLQFLTDSLGGIIGDIPSEAEVLDKCNSVSRLDFNPREKIDEAFNKVGNYRPISRAKLEQENKALYIRLENEGIIYR